MLGLSSLSLALSYTPNGGSAPVSYDFIIQDPADWTDPTYLGLLTTGGTVGVDAYPGGYSNISITATPSSPLIITGTDPNNMPIIDKLTLGNLTNVTLTTMRVVTSSWNSSPTDPITMGTGGGTCVIGGTVNLEGLFITGNYRGDIDAYQTFDYTSHDIPEYACIKSVTSGGSYGPLSVDPTSEYIGDLLADGVGYSAIPRVSGGSGFIGTFDVVGGRITNPLLVSGGTGYADQKTPQLTLNIYASPARMVAHMCNGVGGKMSVPSGATFNFHNNTGKFLGSFFKPAMGSASTSGTISIVNNELDGYYTDSISFSLPTAPTLLEYKWNRFTRHFGRTTDVENPHGDCIQLFRVKQTAQTVADVRIIGNEALNSIACRSDAEAFVFLSDSVVTTNPNPDPPGTKRAYSVYFVGNSGMTLAPKSYDVDVMENCFVYGNNGLPGKPTSTPLDHVSAVSIVSTLVAAQPAYGQNLFENNIAEDVRVGAGATPRTTVRNNTKTGLITTSSSYSTYFGVTTDPATIAEARTMRKGVGAYADHGCYRDSAWINHAAQTHDPSLEPSFVRFPTVINQTASSIATSDWCRIIGGPDSQSVSVSGGTYDTATSVALDGTVTGLTSGLTSGTHARGTYVRMNVATASAGSTATTATMTIRGTYTFDFNAITATASSYTIADNQGTAYSRITSLPTFTGGVGFIWALRFRVDAYTPGDYLFANQTGTQLNLQYQTNQWRLTMKNGSTVGSRFVMSQQAGTMVTLIAAFDLTQTDKELACRMFSNGVELSHTSSNSAYGGPTTLANTDIWNTQSLNILSNNTGTLDGAIEWLWFDIYTSIGSMPDVSDPAVLAEFSTDKFAADFSTSILPQPKLAYGGASSLASWDGTFTNAGSHAGANLVKQAGTYV